MAIQFHCPGCSQPIEVDDVYAGQTAACPYCHRVGTVPRESTLDQTPPTAARPAVSDRGEDAAVEFEPVGSRGPTTIQPPPPPSPAELHVGPALSYRDQAARRLGTYALICTGLAVLLFAAVFVYSVAQFAGELMQNPASQPSPERMAELEAKLSANPWAGAATMGAAFFALVGMVLGVTSLVQSRRRNWRAVVSVVICGLFVLCVCGGMAMAIMSGLAAPA